MKAVLKRFRYCIYSILLCLIFYFVSESASSEDSSGMFSAICLLLGLAALVLFIWALFKAIGDAHRYNKTGEKPIENKSVITMAADTAKEHNKTVNSMSPAEKSRYKKFQFIGVLLIAAGVGSVCCGLVVLATLLWIAGIAVCMMGNPAKYNASSGNNKMVMCPKTITMEKMYEDLKDLDTPLGSAYIGKIAMVNKDAIIWGPDSQGNFIYFYKNKAGDVIYLQQSMFTNYIKEVKTKRTKDPDPLDELDYGTAVCYQLSVDTLLNDIVDILKNYIETGKVRPVTKLEKGAVYFFDENFKLTGQKFTLKNAMEETVYDIDGTYPLVSFHIKEHVSGDEVFTVTKEVLEAMPTYRFYEKGNPVGQFKKKIVLTHDVFEMDMPEGKLSLIQQGAELGDNYLVDINGVNIGSIAERLNFNLQNIVFDNSVLVVRDPRHLPLMTALAIMVARELQRDRDLSHDTSDTTAE